MRIVDPPLRVPRKRSVSFGGVKYAEREFFNDINAQTLSDIEYLLKFYTWAEIEEQARNGNEATRLIVDRMDAKPLDQAERNTEVLFGDVLQKSLLNRVKRALMQAVRDAVQRAEKDGRNRSWNRNVRAAMVSSSSWEWIYVPPKGQGRGRRVTDPSRIGPMPAGARMILRPRIPDVEYENMLALWRDMGYRRPPNIVGKGNKGVYATRANRGAKGFMAKSIDKIKRYPAARSFTIYAAFTVRYEPAGSKFKKQGAPIIVIRALAKTRTYKRVKARKPR